jgi:hypothetical protein
MSKKIEMVMDRLGLIVQKWFLIIMGISILIIGILTKENLPESNFPIISGCLIFLGGVLGFILDARETKNKQGNIVLSLAAFLCLASSVMLLTGYGIQVEKNLGIGSAPPDYHGQSEDLEFITNHLD